MAAHDLHKNLPKTTGILDQLEDAIDIHSDLHDRISELSEHIWARIQLGQVDKARTLLNQMLRTSFGIYHRKDTQLSKWADWAARFAQLCDDSTIAKKTLGELLKTIPIQSSTGRGDEVEAATGRLLASAAELDHEWAYGVAKHFLDTGSAKRTAVISGVVAGCVASGNQDAVEAGVVATTRILIPFETETSQILQDAIAVKLKDFPGLASLPDLRRALLFDDMRSPVLDLAREARRGLRDLVLRRYGLAEIEARAKALLRSEGAELLAGVVLVATIYETNPDWVKGLQIELVPLAWSPSAVVRRIVQPILIALEIPFKEGGPSTQIPAIYKLELPKAQMRKTSSRGAPPAGAALPDTTDSYDLSSMFHGALKRLAQDEGPSFEAMVNRFASLMKEISPPESWSNAYETKLGETLSAIGLASTFRRPRSLAAQLAFAHLVAELVDAGLAEWPNADIDEWLMPLDPVSENLEPQPRPAWLSLQKPGEAENFKSRGWARRIAENLDLPQKRTPAGGMVLAEMTTIESHEHGKPRETRVSMIAHREWPIPSKEELDLSWFAFSRRYFPSEYPFLHRLSKKLMSAVSGEPYFADAGFLALNPVLANSLGWEPSDQGLFRWVDAEGQTMAESIYWQEGNCNHRGTYGFHEIGAQGWLVVATPDATIALQDALKYCRRVTCIERHFREQFADAEHFSELIFGAV